LPAIGETFNEFRITAQLHLVGEQAEVFQKVF
jgi:hypothetical protein